VLHCLSHTASLMKGFKLVKHLNTRNDFSTNPFKFGFLFWFALLCFFGAGDGPQGLELHPQSLVFETGSH
jgi:hypothetical protein